MRMPIWMPPTWNDQRKTNALPKERTTSRTHPWGNKQEVACPYCNKTYCERDKLFTHVELAPRKGKRDVEIRPHLQTEDDPKENGSTFYSRWKETCLNSDSEARNFPTNINDQQDWSSKTEPNNRKGKRKMATPKSTTKTAGHPERATDPTPSKPQGSHPPRMIQIQPPEPEQDQQIKKQMGKNNKKQGNNTHKEQ